jgi:selenocysteine-specific elongation factor
VSRVALNLAGDELDRVEVGSALVTRGAWQHTDLVDVRLTPAGPPRPGGSVAAPPQRPLLHVGAAAVTAHHRPLGEGLARLRLERPLPLRVGDRALLRDPGSRRLWAVTVLDPVPPPLTRRGAAAARARQLAGADGTPDLAAEVERRGQVHADLLERIGVPVGDARPLAAGWFLSEERRRVAGEALTAAVREHDRRSPLDPGLPLSVAAERAGLPAPELVRAVAPAPLDVHEGRIRFPRSDALPAPVETALARLGEDLAGDPFAAPTADRLRELGLDTRAVAAAAKAGRVLRVAPGVVLLPGADRHALDLLRELPQPFTSSQARVALGTSRRVALPLLEHLDRAGLTRRLPDDRRAVAGERAAAQ